MQPMIVSSTYKVNELIYTFWCATLSAAYICNPSVQNYCVLAYLFFRHLSVQPLFLSSTYYCLGYTTLISSKP